MAYRWTLLDGAFDVHSPTALQFHGRTIDWIDKDGKTQANGADMGLALCDVLFSGGKISAKVRFEKADHPATSAGIVIWSHPASGAHITAAVGRRGGALFSVNYWDGKITTDFPNNSAGTGANLLSGHEYDLAVNLKGSELIFSVDGVQVVKTNLPGGIARSSPGVWCFSQNNVDVYDYKISLEKPKAFVVMQFTQQYNELYNQVIVPACNEMEIDAVRADETYGPGLIIADITSQIKESKMIIAEITPSNANVYYEVGYAHALQKPTILIAEKNTALPFDVSPFRVLMYENTIEGKAKIEIGLRRHLSAILSQQA